jgi:hypothetical protein
MGAVVLAVAASTLAVSVASAATAPSAPYTALTMHFEGWGYIDGSFSYEPSRNTLTVNQNTPNGYAIFLQGFSGSHWHWLNVTPPIGSHFVAGTTYDTVGSFSPSPTETVLNLAGDGQGCDGAAATPGTLAVQEASYDGGGLLTAFAASYSVACSGVNRIAKGEIRFQSSQPYRATDSWEYRLQFGQQAVGVPGTPQDVTVEVNGVQDTTFGAATLGGDNPDAFTISANTCTGTLSYGQTCAVSITPNATALGGQSALLTLAENSFGGKITKLISLDGFDPRDATASPPNILFGDVAAYHTSDPMTVTLTGSGMLPITFGTAAFGGANASVFTKTADTCSGATLAAGQTCVITATARPTTAQMFTNAPLDLPDNSVAGFTRVVWSVNGFDSDQGTYYPIPPHRLLDTRSGLGVPAKGKVGPGGVVHLKVTGLNNVSFDNIAAVVLNVTVTGPTAGGYVAVYPTGVQRPNSSSLNFPAGWTGANSVTAAVGAGGQVDLYNAAGSTHLIADMVGYYSNGAPPNMAFMGGQYHAVTPVRLADTRTWSSNHARIPGGHFIVVPASVSSTINLHVSAFAVNITAVSPTKAGYLTAWNGYAPDLPSTSTLNYAANKTVPNFAIVRTMRCNSSCGSANGWPAIGVYTSAPTHIIVDIVGYYDDATVPNGLRFTPSVPTRIADTRAGQGWPSALGPGATATIATPASVAGPDVWALAMNVTAVRPTIGTFLSVWPAGLPGVGRPNVSNLNPATGQTVPNAVQTLIGPANEFNVYNSLGSVNVLVDVVGTFYLYPGTAQALQSVRTYTPSPSQLDTMVQPVS